MNNQSISLYDINSINFYSRVREIETHIPPYGLIRIGQKHKYCFYNFKNNTRNLISVEDIREKNIDSYFVEPTPKLSGFAANFLMVLPNNKGLEILYKHHKTKIARNALFSYAILKKYVSPRYLVTPSISKSNRSWGFA